LAKKNEGVSNRKHDGKDAEAKAKHVQDSNEAVCFSAGRMNGGWIVDSGATCHMTNDRKFFSSITESIGSGVSLADGQRKKVAVSAMEQSPE